MIWTKNPNRPRWPEYTTKEFPDRVVIKTYVRIFREHKWWVVPVTVTEHFELSGDATKMLLDALSRLVVSVDLAKHCHVISGIFDVMGFPLEEIDDDQSDEYTRILRLYSRVKP